MKNEVDNFEKIYPLLEFKNEGDFYWVSLILRKKDKTTTFGNKNNSARIIKTYNVYNIDYLKIKEKEIKELCNLFGCRAGIYLNRRNDKEVAFEMLTQLSTSLKSQNYHLQGLYNSCVGSINSKQDKYWLLDCDSSEEYFKTIGVLLDSSIKPEGEKIVAKFPTYSGFHVVTKRFDRMIFDKLMGEIKVDIHKNNPVCLFYPEQKELI